MDIIRPPRLRPGQLIALVSPASPIADTSRIERGVRYLEGLGYHTILGASITRNHGYLAGTDEERVADLHAMFTNPEVRAVMCIRGGYGTPRLLSLVNYRLIARNPKILLGYSDITALQLAIWRKTRLVTFHGPMVGVDMADPMDHFTEELLWSVLTSAKRRGPIALPEGSGQVVVPGKARGRLLGGNLALLVSILGTPHQPDFTGSILFLEDIGEEPYRVDRMLAQLRNASILSRASAILSGQFTDCVPQDKTKPSFHVEEVIQEAAHLAGRPFLFRLPFGHESIKMTIPVGAQARVDADRRLIDYVEAAVR